MACLEVGQHRAAGRNGGIAKFGVGSHAPRTQQAAYDDAAIEKVRKWRARRAAREFERKRSELPVPGLTRKKMRRPESRIEVGGVPSPFMQKQENTNGITGDFRGYARILPEIGAVVARHPAAGFLNSRVQEPAAGRIDQGIGRWQRKLL